MKPDNCCAWDDLGKSSVDCRVVIFRVTGRRVMLCKVCRHAMRGEWRYPLPKRAGGAAQICAPQKRR